MRHESGEESGDSAGAYNLRSISTLRRNRVWFRRLRNHRYFCLVPSSPNKIGKKRSGDETKCLWRNYIATVLYIYLVLAQEDLILHHTSVYNKVRGINIVVSYMVKTEFKTGFPDKLGSPPP